MAQDETTPTQNPSTSMVFFEDDENFAELYEQSLSTFKEHQIIPGKVIGVGKDYVTVDIGYKSEGQIPVEEFLDENREVKAAIGDLVDVFLEALEDADGMVIISKEKAEKLRVWEQVGRVHEQGGMVDGVRSAARRPSPC